MIVLNWKIEIPLILICIWLWSTGHHIAAYVILGSVVSIVWAIMYITYKMLMLSSMVFKSAAKMKTGNDLAEQYEDTTKNEDIPNFFQFYWRMIRKEERKKNNEI